jgi:hypothetical protein
VALYKAAGFGRFSRPVDRKTDTGLRADCAPQKIQQTDLERQQMLTRLHRFNSNNYL